MTKGLSWTLEVFGSNMGEYGVTSINAAEIQNFQGQLAPPA